MIVCIIAQSLDNFYALNKTFDKHWELKASDTDGRQHQTTN